MKLRKIKRKLSRKLRSLYRSVTRPFRRAVRAVSSRSKKSNKSSGVVGILLSIVYFPFTLIRLLWRQWRRAMRKVIGRRQMRFALQGSIAATVGLVAVVTISARLTKSEDVVLSDYRMAADLALADEDYGRARIYYERILQISPGNRESRYLLASTLEQLGLEARAESMMHDLAPDSQNGYAMAHLWIAQQILEDANSEEKIRDAKRHLMFAVESDSTLGEAHNLLARILVQHQEFAEAIPHLEFASRQQPALLMSLANVYQLIGKEDDAVKTAKQARTYFQAKTETTDSDFTSRTYWAQAEAYLGQFQKAERILLAGKSIEDRPELNDALVNLYLLHFDVLGLTSETAEHQHRLVLLQKILGIDPSNSIALQRLVGVGDGDSETAQAAQEMLNVILAGGTAPPVAHLAAGSAAYVNGDIEKAQLHLEIAYKRDPKLAVVANNLAWILIHHDLPNPDRALLLVDSALDLQPENPVFRDTRGRVYARLGRWKDAIADLEFALPTLNQDASLHRELSAAYFSIELDELGEKHLIAAENLEKPAKPLK